MIGNRWQSVLELDARRHVIAGDASALRQAIARGADLRIYSEFWHHEHIEPGSSHRELVQETMDMRCAYLVEERWAAGILTLRQPVQLPDQFGPRPSLSLFLYNENGEQAVARPFLDGPPARGMRGAAPLDPHLDMPKYHEFESWDAGTNGPSSNFAYDFDRLRYIVSDDWTEVLAHDAAGAVVRGGMNALADAFRVGADLKIAITGLCDDLSEAVGQAPCHHEVFTLCGSCYLYVDQPLFIASSHPVVRVVPAAPLRYASGNWDYSWLLARSDGQVAMLSYDPYTLTPRRHEGRFAVRWFAR